MKETTYSMQTIGHKKALFTSPVVDAGPADEGIGIKLTLTVEQAKKLAEMLDAFHWMEG